MSSMTDAAKPSLAAAPVPILILVAGPPCAGKTTIARRLSSDLQLPLMSKDMIKESLYDSLGWRDREWSRSLGSPAMELLFLFSEAQVATGRSCIIEANFWASLSTGSLLQLKLRHPYVPLQVRCDAEPAVLNERFRRRTSSGERHPGHADAVTDQSFFQSERLEDQATPLPIGGEIIKVDTTGFGDDDMRTLSAQVGSAFARLAAGGGGGRSP